LLAKLIPLRLNVDLNGAGGMLTVNIMPVQSGHQYNAEAN
jgi:hypothetical protein